AGEGHARRAPGDLIARLDDETRAEGVHAEGRDVAADALRLAQHCVAQVLEAARVAVAVEEHRVDAVARARGPARTDLADRSEHERRVGLLYGLGLERDVGDLVEAAVE